MRFIKHDVAQCSTLENGVVARTKKQIFEHSEIREENVRGSITNFLTSEAFVRSQDIGPVFIAEIGKIPGRIAGVAPERDLRNRPKQSAETIKLVVGKGVHRVHDYGSYSGP